MAQRPRTSSSAAKWLAGVLIGALVVGTGVLVFLALQRTQATDGDQTPDPVPSFTLGAPRAATPTPEASASPAPITSTWGAEERFLTVGSGTIWRATAGECGTTEPLMERSDDGGESWVDVTPLYRGIREVVSLDAFAGSEAESIAAMGDGCEIQALRTFTQGEFWAPYDDVLAASRYLDPSDSGSVITPSGPVAAPCAAPSGFRAQGEIVALICEGTVHRLTDDEWQALPAENVATLAIDGDTILTAGTGEGCAGTDVVRWTGDGLSTSEALGCAPDVDPSRPIAVAGDGPRAVIWSADTVRVIP